MKKRILSIFVTVCMLLTMLPTAAFATGSDGDQTTLDVSKGNITIGADTVSGYDSNGTAVTTADPDGYIITGTTTSNTVRITGGSHAVHVRELDINATYAAFYIENAHVDLLLLGNCTLDSGNGYYDLHLGANASVTINGNGTLYAGYIGGENGGTITIENGGFDFDRVYTGGIGTITIKGGIYKYGYPDENCVGMQKVPVAERYKVIEDSTRAWPYEVVHEGYNISFHAGDGGSGTMGSLTGVSGSYTLPKCTFTAPAGKVFAGWSTTENGAVITERSIAMDQDYTFYAQWVDISDAGVAINEANFPDAAFRDYVAASFDINQNGYLSDADIFAATEINVMGQSITSLTGVEHFTALTKLRCDTNQLTSLDISKNTSLLELDCGANDLTSLDVSNNTLLTRLTCDANKLTSLDVGNNTQLSELECSYNELTALDVSKNTVLTYLGCNANELITLDVSNNTRLVQLECSNNQLTALDLSMNPQLSTLFCSGNAYLISVGADRTFDLKNLPGDFDVTKANNWTGGTVEGNVLKVKPDTTSVTYTYATGFDGSVTFTLNVLDTLIQGVLVNESNFPDAVFRGYVSTQFDTNNDSSLSKEEIDAATEISVTRKTITSLQGVEYFTALTELVCDDCQLTSLDVSKNTALVKLSCVGNQLTSLDVSSNINLGQLVCSNNQLTSLNVKDNVLLICQGNSYEITVDSTNRTFDLTNLPGDFDATKASNWSGGTVEGNILTVNSGTSQVTYTYACGGSYIGENNGVFTLNVMEGSTYTVSLNANGGTGNDVVKSGVVGNYNLPDCPFTAPDAQQFKGWATAADGEVISGTTITVSANTTLYAIWEDIPVVTVSSIAVNSTTHKTEYIVGDTLDVTGLTILVTKSDSSTEIVNVTSGMVSGFDSTSAVASQTLTITYEDKTTTYNISVAAAPVTKYQVTVTNGTGGGEYAENETVTVTANNPEQGKRFKEWQVVSGGATLADATQSTTTFTMPANAVEVKAVYEEIPAVTVSSIAVNSNAHKTAYTVGDALDVTGLTIEVMKSDNSKETVNVTSGMVSGFDSTSAVASQTLTITYEGKTTTYNISVAAAPVPTVTLTGIAVTTAPTKTVYTAGENFDATGMIVTATYSDQSTEAVTAYTVTDGTALTEGKTTVTISYTEGSVTKTVDQAITVNAVVTFTLTPSATSISGGGTVTILANKPVKQGTFTCSGGITVTQEGDLSFTASLPNATATYTFSAEAIDGTTATCTVSVTRYTSGGGGGGGGSSNTTSSTERNPDGSTTTTTENKVTGTVTETTKNTDGSTETVETKKDGTVTTTVKDSDGSTTKTVETPEGGVEAEATVSNKAGNEIVADAKENGASQVVIAPEIPSNATKTEVSIPASTVGNIGNQTDADLTVSTPVADVSIPNGGLSDLAHQGGQVTVAAEKSGNTVELTVTAGRETVTDLPGGITLTVPVEDAAPGTVAVLVKADGTEEVIRKSVAQGDTLIVPLEGSAAIKVVDAARDFADTSGHWAEDAIDFASSHRLYQGTSAQAFSPDGLMTRAMLMTVMARLDGQDTGSGELWYQAGMDWAVELGISDGSAPMENISREQMITMLYRYAVAAGCDVSVGESTNILSYNDAFSISEYAFSAMQWACGEGIITGRPGGFLSPEGSATRAEVAAILMRFVTLLAK